MVTILDWTVFVVAILGLMGYQWYMHRNPHDLTKKEALQQSGICIAVALAFGGYVFWRFKGVIAGQYYAGWTIEQSMSVDNLAMIVYILKDFHVPRPLWHKLLFYGIVGAFVFRGIIFAIGINAIQSFTIVFYIFGLFLIFTAGKLLYNMIKKKESNPQTWNHPVLRFIQDKLHIRMSSGYEGDKFFVVASGLMITPLLAALIVVELSDLVFAVDSLPAIMGVTSLVYIAYTSNAFAIAGLRSLFFVVAGNLDEMVYLNPALSFILGFIGLQMILRKVFEIPNEISLLIIGAVLSIAVVASYIYLIVVKVTPSEIAEGLEGYTYYDENKSELDVRVIPMQGPQVDNGLPVIVDGFYDRVNRMMRIIFADESLGFTDRLPGVESAVIVQTSFNMLRYFRPIIKHSGLLWGFLGKRTIVPPMVQSFLQNGGMGIAYHTGSGAASLWFACLGEGGGRMYAGEYTPEQFNVMNLKQHRLDRIEYGNGAFLLPTLKQAYMQKAEVIRQAYAENVPISNPLVRLFVVSNGMIADAGHIRDWVSEVTEAAYMAAKKAKATGTIPEVFGVKIVYWNPSTQESEVLSELDNQNLKRFLVDASDSCNAEDTAINWLALLKEPYAIYATLFQRSGRILVNGKLVIDAVKGMPNIVDFALPEGVSEEELMVCIELDGFAPFTLSF